MLRLRFIHWHAEESSAVRNLLSQAGFQVEFDCPFDNTTLRHCREHPPYAFLIDLSRLPSHGREIAIALRQSPKTRHVPIVFCNGAPEKVKQIHDVLPDTLHCIERTLIKTLNSVKPIESPVRPLDMMNCYGSRTAAQKLGIKPGATVALIGAPRDFESILGELPPQSEIVEENAHVTICFIHAVDCLQADMSRVRSLAAKTKLWFSWRKKTAANHAGVTEALVRNTGIDLGLVDYKICSIDSTWSAMAFAKRKT